MGRFLITNLMLSLLRTKWMIKQDLPQGRGRCKQIASADSPLPLSHQIALHLLYVGSHTSAWHSYEEPWEKQEKTVSGRWGQLIQITWLIGCRIKPGLDFSYSAHIPSCFTIPQLECHSSIHRFHFILRQWHSTSLCSPGGRWEQGSELAPSGFIPKSYPFYCVSLRLNANALQNKQTNKVTGMWMHLESFVGRGENSLEKCGQIKRNMVLQQTPKSEPITSSKPL